MLALLETLRQRSNVKVLDGAGPFNFSRLCNIGAQAAHSDYLLFLNNDVSFVAADTLVRLLEYANRNDVGAVGAKLLYPDGRIQHVGIALGLYDLCGHFGAYGLADHDGWNGTNQVPHEVSAVTGACLMVQKAKFESVGSFDECFPIELGDVDLCLRLNARGWQTVCHAGVVLTHRESASRGRATFRRNAVHEEERALFLTRWAHELGNDRYHHPAWPLYDVTAPPY